MTQAHLQAAQKAQTRRLIQAEQAERLEAHRKHRRLIQQTYAAKGATMRTVAILFDITPQRVQQIVKREGRDV